MSRPLLAAALLLVSCNSSGMGQPPSEFVPEPLPVASGTSGISVRSIRGTAADDVWVVASVTHDGHSARERFTECYHWDGKAWTAVPCPARTTMIAPSAKHDAWAIGRYGMIARWDGTAFHEERLEVAWDLIDAAAANGHVWVVASGPEIQHFDGTRWEVVKPEPLATNRVQEIFATGGQVFVPSSRPNEAGIVRYDGTSWTREPVGEGGVVRIAGTGPKDVWAFAADKRVHHYDGESWRTVERATDKYLIDAWAASPTDVWVSGEKGMVEHWDGQSWRLVGTGSKEKIWAVWATPGLVLAGGDDGLMRKK